MGKATSHSSAIPQLKVGVIGAGNMGQNHIRVYSQLKNIKLVAVADINSKLLHNIYSQFFLKTYSNYKKMLDNEDLDIVSIAVPTGLHLTVAKDTISKKIHTLIEKPIAATVKDANIIIKLAKKYKVKLGVGHVERFNPVITLLKKYLDNNQAGKIFQITIRRIGPFPHRIKDVGVILDLATHDIDIMYYLTKSKIKNFSIETSRFLNKGHEDLATALVRFKNGIIGVMIENWLSPTKIRDLIINCEKGMFLADFLSQDLYFYENNYTPGPWGSLQIFRGMAEGNMIRYYIARDEPLKLELKAFVNSVLENKPFLVEGIDGLRTIKIAEKLLAFKKNA